MHECSCDVALSMKLAPATKLARIHAGVRKNICASRPERRTEESSKGTRFELSYLAARREHRNKESLVRDYVRSGALNFTEVVYFSVGYRLSVRACQFLFLVM